MDLRFDTRINYQYSMSVFGNDDPRTDEEKAAYIAARLRRSFDVLMSTDEGAGENPVFHDLATVEGFLHGGGLPFRYYRMLIRGLELTFDSLPVTETAILITFCPEFNSLQIQFCFRADDVSTDDLIYLRQIFGGAATFTARDGRSQSLGAWCELIRGAMDASCANVEQTYLIEIKACRPAMTVEQLIRDESQRLYGILCGDEGWQFVPKALADERMEQNWGSREFVRCVIFGSNTMLLNLCRSAESAAYLARQEQFGGKAYGGVNPYFLLDCDVAGVCHGILHSQETVMVIKTIANRILNRKNAFHSKRSSLLGSEIKDTKQFRADLITTLNRVENLGISELGELEQVMLQSYRISPLIDSIKYLLELLESELELLYQQSTNNLVNFLTIISLVLTVISMVAGFF